MVPKKNHVGFETKQFQLKTCCNMKFKKRNLLDAKTQGEDSRNPIPYLHPSNESEGSSFGYGWRMETYLSREKIEERKKSFSSYPQIHGI